MFDLAFGARSLIVGRRVDHDFLVSGSDASE